ARRTRPGSGDRRNHAVTDSEALRKLESREVRERLDSAGYAGMLERLPEQSREAWALGLAADLGEIPPHPARVILVGLGGSAIGADVASTLATELGPTPVQVVRNYQIPPLTRDTLVVLCSFSGNTEEVLCAFDDVTKAGARGIAISTGGALTERARASGMPLIE